MLFTINRFTTKPPPCAFAAHHSNLFETPTYLYQCGSSCAMMKKSTRGAVSMKSLSFTTSMAVFSILFVLLWDGNDLDHDSQVVILAVDASSSSSSSSSSKKSWWQKRMATNSTEESSTSRRVDGRDTQRNQPKQRRGGNNSWMRRKKNVDNKTSDPVNRVSESEKKAISDDNTPKEQNDNKRFRLREPLFRLKPRNNNVTAAAVVGEEKNTTSIMDDKIASMKTESEETEEDDDNYEDTSRNSTSIVQDEEQKEEKDANVTSLESEQAQLQQEQPQFLVNSTKHQQLQPIASHGSNLPQGTIVYGYRIRPTPTGPQSSPIDSSGSPSSSQSADMMAGRMTALVVMAVASVIQNLTRLWVVQWLARKIAGDTDIIQPRQHFIWECLNDKYVRDDDVWFNVLTKNLKPPASMKISQREWNKHVKNMQSDAKQQHDCHRPNRRRRRGGKGKSDDAENDSKSVEVSGQAIDNVGGDDSSSEGSSGDYKTAPPKIIVVVDLSTFSSSLDVKYLADVVSFLVGGHNGVRSKQRFGSEPEFVLNIESGGGEVTIFALAAAQIARLRTSGWKVTVCVDRFAASGGYMIASQADTVLAAPFAALGSIGVISGGLNFNEVLRKYGVKAIELKSGEQKNPISQFGPVTDKDVKTAQKNSDELHRDFIDLCLTRRPMLREDVCDGRVLNGERAYDAGLIDRILTSDEYIFEKIADGHLVLKLHRFAKPSDRTSFLQALQILPHLRRKIGDFLCKLVGNSVSIESGPALDPAFFSNIFKGAAFLSMVHSALKKNGVFGSKSV